jgi:hypothetical protein
MTTSTTTTTKQERVNKVDTGQNKKAYRTKAGKIEAKKNAYRAKDGSMQSSVKTYMHTNRCERHQCVCGKRRAVEEEVVE